MNRAHVFRIYPTPHQAQMLAQFAGASRFVYNLALEQRRDWWRQFRSATGRLISWASQSKELTDLRAQVDWLASVPRSICEQALRDLDRAFTTFYRLGHGYPSFRKAGTHMAFRIQGRDCCITSLNRKWALVRIPGAGFIKIRVTRDIPDRIVSITVRQSGAHWSAAFSFEAESDSRVPSSAEVGVDRGVANTLTLSTGEHFQMARTIPVVVGKRKRAQRILARRKKGSRRRLKQRMAVAELHRKAAACRSHWLHERTTDIASRFGRVAIEKLAVANMTRSGRGKRGLNRSILEQGWSIFANMLEYKLAERGGTLHQVNPAYTSQTCSCCGSVNAESRKSQAVFECVDCGHRAHADTNAAINILRRSPAGVEGAGYGPVEARTGEMPTHLENLAA